MSSIDRDEIISVFDALDADLDRLCALSFEALTNPERLRGLERLEKVVRRMRAPQHALINEIKAQATEEELGGKLCPALANRLLITKAEAARRIAEAEDLGPRRALTGQPLEPVLTATAAAQCAGQIGDGHIKIIRGFFAHLPAQVDVFTREAAETDLARKATWQRPDELAKYAQQILNVLNPDGEYSDEERARKRGLKLGPQQPDGMSALTGLITPELRAALEALLTKLAAPGMSNPADETPVIDGDADQDAVRRDTRSEAQRNHDGLLAGIRALFASGDLGQHRGLPVKMIVTLTLQDLEARTGRALTAGGTLLPLSDIIKMLGQADHYLAIFDKAKPMALFHAKRCANLAQRLMLLAKERGCTRPGCDAPGYRTQVHHTDGWATTLRTDITSLTLACQPDNLLVEKGWITRKNARGDTEWIPPPHLDRGQPRINAFHHPEKLFNDGDRDDGEDDEHEVA